MSTRWKELFEAALSETNAERLQSRIDDARAAILERVNELLDDPERQPEHDEILQAIGKLAQVEAQTRRSA
jgi:Mn-dependent DtxR family transcriptional regulator